MAENLDRRKVNRLTAAAFGGLAAGSLLGCGGGEKADAVADATPKPTGDVHLCRGLNDCKGKGKGGDNACRGQGSCASFEASCGGQNECKGLGGCGSNPGANDCKGQGGCHVPLMAGAWETVRKRLEEEWTAKELAFGEAPPKPEEAKP